MSAYIVNFPYWDVLLAPHERQFCELQHSHVCVFFSSTVPQNAKPVAPNFYYHLKEWYTDFRNSPVHNAILHDNAEEVIDILGDGDDVSLIMEDFKQSPFLYALRLNNFRIAYILLSYFDDYDADLLKFVIEHTFYVHNPSDSANCCKIFQKVFSNSSHKKLLSWSTPFLYLFLYKCNYKREYWLSTTFTVLRSPRIRDLVQQFLDYLPSYTTGYFYKIMKGCVDSQIAKDERVKVIKAWLDVDFTVTLTDINKAYMLFGYGEELLLLVNSIKLIDISILRTQNDLHTCPLTAGIVGLDFTEDYLGTAGSLLSTQVKTVMDVYRTKGSARTFFLDTLKFYAVSKPLKQNLIEKCLFKIIDDEVVRRVDEATEVPSLVQLARGPARIHIKTKFAITKPSEFYAMMDRLILPKIIKDVLLFKRALY